MKNAWIEMRHGTVFLLTTHGGMSGKEIKETYLQLEELLSLKAELEVAILESFREELRPKK